MEKDTTKRKKAQAVCWESSEGLVRQQIHMKTRAGKETTPEGAKTAAWSLFFHTF